MKSLIAVHPDDPEVAGHFEDIDQQRESSSLGMWTFLATEVLFFGALFVGYFVYRVRYPEAFRRGSEEMNLWLGGLNTAVLLTSSLTMALGVHAAGHGDNRGIRRFLAVTMVLGLAFLGIKAIEYAAEAHERLVPAVNFSTIPPDEAGLPSARQHPRPHQVELFMIFYFVMTGLHALHMIVGVSVLSFLFVLTGRGWFTARWHNPIETAGLYWHFVDIVWVFLYPCLYLLRQG